MHRLFTLLACPSALLRSCCSRTECNAAPRAAAVATPGACFGCPDRCQIRAKLAKSKIGKDGFKYHVQHGVVTWEGTTGVIQHKGSATRMAKTAGATQVVNNIQISDAAKAKAAANLKKAVVQQ